MDENELTALETLRGKIVTIANDIDTAVDMVIFDSDVIDQILPSIKDTTGMFAEESEDFGSVFGVDVGMIHNHTYKKILELIIEDKNTNINSWKEIINTHKHTMEELCLPF